MFTLVHIYDSCAAKKNIWINLPFNTNVFEEHIIRVHVCCLHTFTCMFVWILFQHRIFFCEHTLCSANLCAHYKWLCRIFVYLLMVYLRRKIVYTYIGANKALIQVFLSKTCTACIWVAKVKKNNFQKIYITKAILSDEQTSMQHSDGFIKTTGTILVIFATEIAKDHLPTPFWIGGKIRRIPNQCGRPKTIKFHENQGYQFVMFLVVSFPKNRCHFTISSAESNQFILLYSINWLGAFEFTQQTFAKPDKESGREKAHRNSWATAAAPSSTSFYVVEAGLLLFSFSSAIWMKSSM